MPSRSFYLVSISLLFIHLMACATTSTSKIDYVDQGNQYARDGLLREAGESYKKALEEKPDDFAARRNLGLIQVKIADYKNAVKNLEKTIDHFDANFDANYYLAEAYRAQEKYGEAIFRYQRALKIRTNEPRCLKALAWSYFKIRYYTEAATTAKHLQKVAPNDGQAAIILARTYLKLNDYKNALATITQAKAKAPAYSLAYFRSVEGDVLFGMGRYADAAQTYQAALKDQPLLAGALLGLGRCYMENGTPTKAITFMERAIHIRPKLVEALYLLGKVYETVDKQKSLKYYALFRKQAATDPEFLALISEVKQRTAALTAVPATSPALPAAQPARTTAEESD